MFEFLFKYPRSAFDAGELSLTSGWPLWAGVTLLVLAALLLALSLWRQRQHLSAPRLYTLWVLQSAMMAVALLMLWQPALTLTSVRAGENAVALLLDNSASMGFADTDRSRREQAVELLDQTLSPALGETFNIEAAAFGAEMQTIENFQQLPDAADSSHLADALLEVLDQARATPLAAVIVATDGNDTSVTPDADFWDRLASFGVPVHTIGYGEELIAGDVEISKIDLAPRTLPGSVERATVTLRYKDADQARIRVYAGSDLVAIEEITLAEDASEVSRSIDLPAGSPGLQELRFEVVGDGTDRVPDNNSRQRLLQVADEQRRILYFEGDPRWEYKFMRRAVHDADGLSLVSLLRTTPNKFYRQGITDAAELENGFPATKEDLYHYDAVIIGNVESVSLNSIQQQLLHDYVAERGGNLMMLAGASALADGGWQGSPLAAALPVLLPPNGPATYARKRAKVQLTSEGSYSPITRLDDDNAENLRLWAEMPELADYQLTGALKPGARALLALDLPAGSQPLLSHQRYGKGQTYVLATGGTWRWQMQLPHADLRHEIFWRQLLNALAATAPQRIEVSLPHQVFRDESQVLVSATALDERFDAVTDAQLSVTVRSPDGREQQLPMVAQLDQTGRYEATIEAAQTGSWQLDVSADFGDDQIEQTTRWFSREDGTAEVFALARDSNFLTRIADTSGGRYWPAGSTDALAETLQTDSSGLTRQQTWSLWNAPFFFLLLLGLKLLEWLLRLAWRRL